MPFDLAECLRCRGDFPALRRTLDGRPLAYLDGPAGTQVPQPVIDAVSDYYSRCNANTHGSFITSAESDEMLLEARRAVAAFLGAPSWRSISFGANMTTLCFSLAHALGREMGPGDEVVITQLDHEANRGPWLTLQERGVAVREVTVRRDGTLDPDSLQAAIGERTRMLAIGYASNALGTVNDIALARQLTRAVNALLVVDAVHGAPHFPLDVTAMDADFLMCSAYKFYAPHVGILYAKAGLQDQLATDRLHTQEQEAPHRIETGTLNHAAIAGVLAAVDYLATWGEGATRRDRLVSAKTAIAAWERRLASLYHERVGQLRGVTVWGPDFSPAQRAPTVSVTVAGHHPTELARRLGEQGVLVWDGHFYAARVVEVLGLAQHGGLLRTGISMYTTEEEVERLLSALSDIVSARQG